MAETQGWFQRTRTRARILLWEARERRRRDAEADLAERNELAEKGIKRELRKGMGGF